MSANNTAVAAGQPEGTTYLYDHVYVPVLLEKLAAAGIVPGTQTELQQTLELAGMLRNANDETVAKEKTAGMSVISLMHSRIGGALKEAGLGHLADARQSQMLKQAAVKAVQHDPKLITAAIAHQDALARSLVGTAVA